MNPALLLGLLALVSGTTANGDTGDATVTTGSTGTNAGTGTTTSTCPDAGTTAFSCTDDGTEFPKTVCYDNCCTQKIVNHIEQEFHAAFKYLYMASVFGQYTVARPGITKFLLESASEERSHAILMLDYLNLRGVSYNEEYKFESETVSSTSVVDFSNGGIEKALKQAIKMEIQVTSLIEGVIAACKDDFHAADVFTNPILDEQHQGLNKLQKAYKTLKIMKDGTNCTDTVAVAEYLFDLKLQGGEML